MARSRSFTLSVTRLTLGSTAPTLLFLPAGYERIVPDEALISSPISRNLWKYGVLRRCPPRRTSGSFVTRCKSKNTKQSEVSFHAVLGEGTREVRLYRVLGG